MHRFPRRGGGGSRGRGMGSGRGGRGGFMAPPPCVGPPPPPIYLPGRSTEVPFDFALVPDIFPRSPEEADDSALTAGLLKRNSEVTPSSDEMQAMQNLVSKIQNIIESIILSPGAFTECQLDEIRQVGSFKQGTVLAGHRTADFVVILKTFPTKEAVEALHAKVAEELKETGCLRSATTEHGFDLTNLQGTARILITTVVQNMRKLDAETHLNPKLMDEHWQAIKHSRWVEENANTSTIKVLVRILRDIRNRFEAFKPLPPFKLDLLAHYAVTNTVQMQPIPLGAAFRRVLSLMSTGIFLPTYAGTTMRGIQLSPAEADKMTAAAQSLLLIVAQGGFNEVLGLSPCKDMLEKPTTWSAGVVIIQPQRLVCDQNQNNSDWTQDIDIDDPGMPSPSPPIQF